MTIPYTFFPSTEEVVSDEPLVLRRVVRWGECDPAGIAYTPRFLDYVVSVHEAFISLMLGGPIHMLKDELSVDFPVRGVEIDFRSTLPLDTRFEMVVHVGEIRSRTFDIHINAYKVEAEGKRRGDLAFVARITPVTIDHESRAAVALPEKLKSRVEAYAAAHPHQQE
ncbi:thioesterase family protein [Sulfitobacter pseudonitzschiae]|uniref:Thioesterase family protein n=1 Tax=Pseudosulfitobacter pseudonitzschiae TaxID=1402135 RepID=A0A9Q2NM48_9RHOB|nr:thioesterase family protein [Pseudosulfitobacter pseudonitzschiae]MBM2294490.1 thioesterase family protein [Pseudosulfitobacter pseudonitzschiae]MBM2299458.1 thioesterase family protein [Pseudosulfitobacter pseudonitzschiae]MBM2304322.1 thioesterase family protein [Pseudosulfitobacter pseudonitzschiae]MBM2314102.1 thioesterase family protein [Pseudosulfitobacter pseudonitzschiae]MBM2319017.1 thioesterase family protein [Pseudosulfitobacter pseudonitzschiae]